MANHLTPEIGEEGNFIWITESTELRWAADKVISKMRREDIIVLLNSIALNQHDQKEVCK
jgi:hypothetical protein